MRIFIFLFLCLSTTTTQNSAMADLLKSSSIFPSGWSSFPDFCERKGINCDVSNRVIFMNFALRSRSLSFHPSPNSLSQLTTLSVPNNQFSAPSSAASPTFFVPGEVSKGSSASAGLVAGVVIAVLVFVVFVMFVSYKCYMKKGKQRIEYQEDVEKGGSFLRLVPDFLVRFSYESLLSATNNFDIEKKLGAGGFGSVFEGSLSDGTKIAVKRLDRLGQGRMGFFAEVQTIGCVHHVNLVKLVGFCAENEHMLLVYEYLTNGSLDKWIFSTNPRGSLNWDAKRKVILQIAKGLAYLHEGCQETIAHLDVKPQNVLLDDEFNVKLSDFGLAKLCDKNESYVMIQVRGTRGYLAPEWLGTKITERADVYSYGVVVLEVVFGRKNLDYSQPDKNTLLIHMVKQKVEEGKLLDLLNQCSDDIQNNVEDVEKIIKIALWCLHSEPEQRPSMSMVVKALEGAMILAAVSDYSLKFVTMDGNQSTTQTITELSASVLSGPR